MRFRYNVPSIIKPTKEVLIMLERIREGSQSFAAKAVLVLIILTFALAGVGSYVTGGADTTVAEVNGAEITQTEYDRAYENERAAVCKSNSVICSMPSARTQVT